MADFYKSLPSDPRKTVTVRCAGYRPHPQLLKRLKRFHPSVDLMWEPTCQRWALVQTDQEEMHIITFLVGPDGEYLTPDLDNTVGFLDRSSSENFATAWALDRWIDRELTDEYFDRESEDRAAANLHEFSDRIFHLQKGRVAVVPDPTNSLRRN